MARFCEQREHPGRTAHGRHAREIDQQLDVRTEVMAREPQPEIDRGREIEPARRIIVERAI